MSPTGFEQHDHTKCVTSALHSAEQICAQNRLQLTPVRRRVLEILLADHRAHGAYDILSVLAGEGLGSQPPVAYRALDFLEKQGFIHKIERLNAWMACTNPDRNHNPAFMICTGCDAVAEVPTRPQQGPLGEAARKLGFEIGGTVIEAEGTCPACREQGQADD